MKADQEVIQEIKSGNVASFWNSCGKASEDNDESCSFESLRNLNLAEDVVQDSFIKAYQNSTRSKDVQVFAAGFTRSPSTRLATSCAV